jgi:hypothetical protein
MFDWVLPVERLQAISESKRLRHYDNVTTFWAWLSQIFDENESCMQAVAEVQAWRAEAGLPMLSSIRTCPLVISPARWPRRGTETPRLGNLSNRGEAPLVRWGCQLLLTVPYLRLPICAVLLVEMCWIAVFLTENESAFTQQENKIIYGLLPDHH